MVDGAVRAPPYGGVIWLCGFLERDWREFDGWAFSRGCDVRTVDSVRGLNLLQFWVSENRNAEELHKIEALCNGELSTTIPPKVVVPGSRILPPKPWWWGSDELASQSTMKATHELR